MSRVTEETKAVTRARLLKAAADAFAAHGVSDANINEISLAAGLAKGTVYNYFPSKEALFHAVIEQACARVVADVRPAPGSTTREKLVAFLDADIAWVRKNEASAQCFVREMTRFDPSLYPQRLAALAPSAAVLIEMLEDGVTRGEVRDDVPVDQLALVFAGLEELALIQHWGSGGGWPHYDEIPRFVVDQFLNGAGRSTR
jgi:AcrR family transcriptional regulator